ncbi:MAG: glucose-6-phosphate isomerase [Methanomicrobiales archaeon]|nr:glucose-6-phosphate isomerase [Methanomicrobiales archaeon]
MKGWTGSLEDPEFRTADDMREVLADPTCPFAGPLYSMYRDRARNARDRKWLEKQHLRYDITCIPARTLCDEYVKTKGHVHPPSPSGIDYPEIYEVLDGVAHYLLQRRDGLDILVIEAHAGEKAIIPPGYGHVTINPGSADLVMANIVSTEFSSDYTMFTHQGGAAYFEMLGRVFVKNPRYPSAPLLRRGKPIRPDVWGIPDGAALYDLVGNAGTLAFLNDPAAAQELLTRIPED